MSRWDGKRPKDLQDALAGMREDANSIMASGSPSVDLQQYLDAVSRVCAVTVSARQLVGADVVVTKGGGITIRLYFPVEDGDVFSLYSAEPDLHHDVLALFVNVVGWIQEHEELQELQRPCSVAGHTDQWDLAITSQIPSLRGKSGPEQLWRVCGELRTPIDLFLK